MITSVAMQKQNISNSMGTSGLTLLCYTVSARQDRLTSLNISTHIESGTVTDICTLPRQNQLYMDIYKDHRWSSVHGSVGHVSESVIREINIRTTQLETINDYKNLHTKRH